MGINMTANLLVQVEVDATCPKCGWKGGSFGCPKKDKECGQTSYTTDEGIKTEPLILPVEVCPRCGEWVELHRPIPKVRIPDAH